MLLVGAGNNLWEAFLECKKKQLDYIFWFPASPHTLLTHTEVQLLNHVYTLNSAYIMAGTFSQTSTLLTSVEACESLERLLNNDLQTPFCPLIQTQYHHCCQQVGPVPL